MHEIKMFDGSGALNLNGYSGSGADWFRRGFEVAVVKDATAGPRLGRIRTCFFGPLQRVMLFSFLFDFLQPGSLVSISLLAVHLVYSLINHLENIVSVSKPEIDIDDVGTVKGLEFGACYINGPAIFLK
jgi:hypothetical protein